MSKLSLKPTLIWLILITLLSFWLRLTGIQFGLPFEYHPDEQQYILPAVGLVSGNFKPLAHYNPAFYPYVIGVVYSLTYLGLKTFGAFPDFFSLTSAWSEPMLPWTAGMIYLARYVSVASGVLTTLMVYRLGCRAYSRTTGVGAALIFGLTFLPVREAHFAVSDAPVALGVAVTLYLCLQLLKRASWRDYLLVGLAFGLSTATKYSAGLLLVPIVAAHLLSRRYSTWLQRIFYGWQLLLTGVISVVTYSVVSPYTLLEWSEFWADFSENVDAGRSGFQGLDLDPAGGLAFYLKGLIWGFGWPLFILFLIAIVFALWRHRRVDLFMLIFPLFGFWYMQRQEMYFVRWLTPFLPALAVLAAETAQTLTQKTIHYLQTTDHAIRLMPQVSRLRQHISLIIILLLTLPSTFLAYRASYIFSQLDTRSEALAWIKTNIPPGSSIATEILSPPWGPPLALPGLQVGPYQFAPVPVGGVAEVELQQYYDWGVQYVVASSYYYARPLRNKDHQAQLAQRMAVLDEQTDLIIEFQPYEPGYQGYFYHDQVFGPANDTLYRHQPGPIIKIYRLP